VLGLAYLGLLKVRRLGTSGRYYVVVPPVPVVRSTAGRRVGFVAEGFGFQALLNRICSTVHGK